MKMAAKFVKPGGLFVAFVPNGSLERLRAGMGYHADWGMYHPVFLDDLFCKHAFRDTPILLVGNPYQLEQIEGWDRRNTLILTLLGQELLLVFPVPAP